MSVRTIAGSLVLAALTSACGVSAADPAAWVLDDGTPLPSLATDEPAVLFVIDPNDVPACQNVLAGWLDWKARSGEAFHLLLSRPPTDAERRILLTLGIRPDGVLRNGRSLRGFTPAEFVVSDGGAVYEAYRVAGASSLLADLRDRPLRAFAASPHAAASSDPQPRTHRRSR